LVAVFARLSSEYLVLLFAIPASAHLVFLWQRRQLPALPWLTDLLIALACVATSWRQALYLTSTAESGSGASPSQLLLASSIVLSLVGLWRWHTLGAVDPSQGSRVERERTRWLAIWFALGLFGLVLLCWGIGASVETFPRTAAFLTFPCWVVAGSLLYGFVRLRREAVATSILLALGVHAGLLAQTPADWATRSLEASPLASLTRSQLNSSEHEPAYLLALDEPSRFNCEPARHRASPFPLDIPEAQRRNVILITVESLRALTLTETYRSKALTPSLGVLQRHGLTFHNAFTSSTEPLYALGGALTGLHPSELLMAPRLPHNVFTLTRDRVDQQQIIFPGKSWFRLDPVEELLVQDTPTQRIKGVKKQVSYLRGHLGDWRKKDRSVFAWVHIEEPGQPYKQRPGFKFGRERGERYRSEVAYTDAQIGRLMKGLEDGGWFDDSLIIVVGAYGEALGQRGYYGHKEFLNGWIVNIPLVIHFPGIEAGSVKSVVELPDLMPTILQWWGVPLPDDLRARSLFETIAHPRKRVAVSEKFVISHQEFFDRALSPVPSLAELHNRLPELAASGGEKHRPMVAIVADDHRMIVERDSGEVELYNRKGDMPERKELSAADPELTATVMEKLRQWHFEQSERIYCRVRAQQHRAAP
jgi:hypothetical protein